MAMSMMSSTADDGVPLLTFGFIRLAISMTSMDGFMAIFGLVKLAMFITQPSTTDFFLL